MKTLNRIFLLLLMMMPAHVSAQFYITGDDPGKLKWNYIDTESYRVIYPQGADSLARVYARELEIYKVPVSRTSGFMTGEGDGRIMPVILHTHNDANGSVAWAPRRMDLYTIPSAYDPEPMLWSTQLAIHESRHVSQMQFGLTERQKPGKWFLGEGWNSFAALLYPGTAKMEGDAVVAETALSSSGRGRTADFLNYFWVAFDHGDYRKWFKWRFVSQKQNSPNYYALGYLTIGGYRYMYDCPDFVSKGLHMVAEHPGRLGCLYDIGKQVSGKKWNDAWADICDTMYGIWKTDADKRAPYIPSERVLPESKRYTDYTDLLVAGSDLYAVKKGHVHNPELVKIDGAGKEKRLSSYAYYASAPRLDSLNNRLLWSETNQNERWTLQSKSNIRFIKGEQKGKIRSKSMLYNPTTSFDHYTAVIEYHPDGSSAVNIINLATDRTVRAIEAPDSVQFVEVASIGNSLYATGISKNGYGIYENVGDTDWKLALSPQPVMIKDFSAIDGDLMFASDRTGVNELYHFDPTSGDVTQKTSTRYGASDFQYSTDRKTLYYSSQTLMGKHIFRTSTDSLLNRRVRFDSLYRYQLADKLSAQEAEAAKKQNAAAAVTLKENDIKLSEPKRYRKVPHMFNFHTWFPAYVSVNNIMNSLSFDPMWETLSLGVSGVFQNNLSTAYGEVGYSAHKDPYNETKWRHSGHFKMTYTGLYPIFELALDFNDRAARQFNPTYYINGDLAAISIYSKEMKSPFFSGKLSTYVPFSFSSRGWSRGFIPRISYTITNDRFNSSMAILSSEPRYGSVQGNPVFVKATDGKNGLRQYLQGSVRAYTMQNIPNSAVYPRWGVGIEAGALGSLGLSYYFSPMGYLYGYGYIPGFIRTQGLRLTAMCQTKLKKSAFFSQQAVDILPRGLSSTVNLGSYVSQYNSTVAKFTADYAIPVYIGDVTLGGNWLAIKRLVLYPHFDYSLVGQNGGLWSAGIDLTADLHAIITLEIPFSVGLTFSWNGGNAWGSITNNGITMNKWFLGPVFNISL